MEDFFGHGRVVHECALRDFDVQGAGLQTGVVQGAGNLAQEQGLAEVLARDIDVQGKFLGELFAEHGLPVLDLRAGVFQHEIVDGVNQSGIFGQ